jgi:hypothetical protein
MFRLNFELIEKIALKFVLRDKLTKAFIHKLYQRSIIEETI